jgi:hypothetical protein
VPYLLIGIPGLRYFVLLQCCVVPELVTAFIREVRLQEIIKVGLLRCNLSGAAASEFIMPSDLIEISCDSYVIGISYLSSEEGRRLRSGLFLVRECLLNLVMYFNSTAHVACSLNAVTSSCMIY